MAIEFRKITTFKDGLRYKLIHFDFGFQTIRTRRAKLGYILWGCDIWIGKIPLLKLILLCNIIIWLILFISRP